MSNFSRTAFASTYTPTLTGVTNVDGSGSAVCAYVRIGNVVMVSGSITVDPTAAASTLTELGISLPVASDFSLTTHCGGTSCALSLLEPGSISADTTNDRATLRFLSQTTSSHSISFMFMYQII